MILIYSLGAILLIGILIYYLIWKDRLNDKLNLDKDWNRFLKSVELNDIKGIALNGDKLIWNKYLRSEQLNIIIEVVDLRVKKYPKLRKLENNAFNKKLRLYRNFPFSWPSGSEKQTF